MRDAKIVTLYTYKGDKGNYNNYGGRYLLSLAGKIFSGVILKRLHRLPNCILPETQSGFGLVDQRLMWCSHCASCREKCREQRKPLFITFVDLTKAFDTVSGNLPIRCRKNLLFTYPFPVNHFFSRGHEYVHYIRWKYIRVFQGEEWR